MARILVIDDEPSVRAAIAQILKTTGHTVIVAGDGQEGIKEHEAEAVDLVITDLFMPNKDGVETILEFRKMAPGLPIIAISGNPMGGDMLAVADQLGATAVFQKPFGADELVRAVEKALAAARRIPS